MSILNDLLALLAQAVADDTGVPVATVQNVLASAENWISQHTGGDTKARADAIAALEADANAGNANAFQALYNWSHSAPVGFPHGNEPSSSLADAQAAWNRLVAAHPTWAAQFTAFSGKPGDSPLDNGGPTLH